MVTTKHQFEKCIEKEDFCALQRRQIKLNLAIIQCARLVHLATFQILFERTARHAKSVVASKKISLMISTNALYILRSVSGESPNCT